MPNLLVGRDREIAALDRHLADVDAGNGTLVLVSGEAGIGKTRLADEISRRARAIGWLVAWGRSWEGEGTPAYWPWLQALRSLRTSAPAAFDETLATSAELSALLSGRAHAPADPAQARFRLLVAVSQLLRTAAVERPILIVLDDVHAADIASQALLQFVARDLQGARVLLVATTRDTQDQTTPAEVAREAARLPLRRLTRDDVAKWVSDAGATNIDAVYATSEGNPLFLHELLSRPEQSQMPLGIREAIRAHLAAVPEVTLNVLETAAVIGRDLSLDALVSVAGPEAAGHAQRAVAAGILIDVGEKKLRFSHVLLRDELYARAGPRRAEVHHVLSALPDAEPAVAAQHALLAARPEDAQRTTELVLTAMRDAKSRLAFADAAHLGRRAAATLGAPLAPADAGALWLAVADAAMCGGADDAEAVANAARFAEAAGDAELLGRVALQAATEHTMNRRDPVIALLRRAVAAQPKTDSRIRARLLGRLGTALLPPLPHEADEIATLNRDALAMARRLDDPDTLFAVLRGTMSTFPETFHADERLRVTRESIALAKRLGQVTQVAQLLPNLVTSCLEAGDADAAAREADAAEELLANYTQPYYQWRMPLVRSMLAAIDGRYADADAENRAAIKLSQDSGVYEGVVVGSVARISYVYLRGDGQGYDAADDVVAMRVLSSNPLQSIFRALPDALLGRTEHLRDALLLMRKHDPMHIPGIYALAVAALHGGVNDHAEFFYDVIQKRYPRDNMLFGPASLSTLGPRTLLLGRLAACLGRRGVALAHFEESLAFARRLRSRPFIAQTERAMADLGKKVAAPVHASILSMSKDGDTWRISMSPQATIVLKDAKGLLYLATLVQKPHQELHVLSLVGADDDGDAGPMLDARAKQSYRERAESLRDVLEEATHNGDLGRAEKAREELDALASELARAVGLGGRDRRAASTAERARINVQRRIRDAIRRVGEHDAALARHFEVSVKTGIFCSYSPSWPAH